MSAEIITIKNFISQEEQQVLRDWGERSLPLLKPNGKHRAYQQIQYIPGMPDEMTAVRRRIQDRFGVASEHREPRFGWYLGSIGDGGAIHEHTDAVPDNYRHLRCNLFVQVPTAGGEPVVEDLVQPYEERMLLGFYPSEARHRCNPVQGDLRRITCSFGYLVPLNYVLR